MNRGVPGEVDEFPFPYVISWKCSSSNKQVTTATLSGAALPAPQTAELRLQPARQLEDALRRRRTLSSISIL